MKQVEIEQGQQNNNRDIPRFFVQTALPSQTCQNAQDMSKILDCYLENKKAKISSYISYVAF